MSVVMPEADAAVLARRARIVAALRQIVPGEGVIAEPLEAVAKAHPDMSLGSYPFFSADGYGSNLVVRSTGSSITPLGFPAR